MTPIDDEFKELWSENYTATRAEMIKHARTKARLTCRELGDFMGLTIGQVADIERGRKEMTNDMYCALLYVCLAKSLMRKEMAKRGRAMWNFIKEQINQ